MKKIIQTVTAFIIAFAMVAAPVADAQTRGRQAHGSTSNSGGGSNHSHGASRPGNNGHGGGRRPGANGNHRPDTPGNRPSKPGAGNGHNRPGNNNGSGNHRPGNDRPGNNKPGNHRPSKPGNNNHRPGHTVPGHGSHHPGAGNGHRPGGNYRPGHAGFRPGRPTPPKRHHAHFHHHVPFFGHFCRPVPPPRWHYRSGGPVFGTILGVALGTAIGASINALVNSGYNVSSYGNDVIYLSNVPQMNYTWPDAALYYNNGALTGSQFTYPSAYYDMSRYNSLYNTFTAQYGMPVQTVNQGGIMSATWYGPANRFVTLSFNSQYGGNFYTTLSFGN